MNKLKMEYVDVDNLVNNPWNSNVMSPENREKLRNSLKRNSSFKPIIVRKLDNGKLEILGGEHRAGESKALGIKKIPAVIHIGLSDNEAKEISIADNARYGADDGLKFSELISSLDEPDALADFLPYSDSEIEVLLSSTSIDLDSLNLLDDDEEIELPQEPETKVTQTHLIMRFKVPIDDAERVKGAIDAVIKSQGYSDADSLTNAGDALVHLLSGGKQ